VIGLGTEGALLAVRDDDFMERVPSVQTRPVVNTVGAGDALFSGFLHAYLQTRNPHQALRLATVFASWKIGVSGGAEGFLTARELASLAATAK
jgi:ribokinase